MHYIWLHISIFIGVAFLVATVIFTQIIKYRRNIKKWWKNDGVWKFIVTVLVPFALPFIITLILYFTDSYKANLDTPKIKEPILWFMIAICVIAFINLCFQFYYWKKEKNDKKIEWENAIYRHAYYSLYDALNAKTTLTYSIVTLFFILELAIVSIVLVNGYLLINLFCICYFFDCVLVITLS